MTSDHRDTFVNNETPHYSGILVIVLRAIINIAIILLVLAAFGNPTQSHHVLFHYAPLFSRLLGSSSLWQYREQTRRQQQRERYKTNGLMSKNNNSARFARAVYMLVHFCTVLCKTTT